MAAWSLARGFAGWFPWAAVLAVVATTLVAGSASADEKLPPRSAEQLLVDLQEADVRRTHRHGRAVRRSGHPGRARRQ